MTYVPCRGCIEKGREPPCYVPDVLQACCDCYLLTPQDRERELDRLRGALQRSERTQRDRFAEAALTGILCSSTPGTLSNGRRAGLVAAAFEIADEAIAQRGRAELAARKRKS